MKRRFAFLAAAAALVLVLAGVALAAYAPRLTVTQGVNSSGTDTTDIAFVQTTADDPTALLRIWSPTGFSPTFNQSPGTQIGTLDGSVEADIGGGTRAVVPVTGAVVVGDPTSPALRDIAKTCTGIEAHTAIWLLSVSAGGTTLPNPVPIFVDSIPGNPVFSSIVQLCLPPPATAAMHIKLLTATLHLTGVFSPTATPGAYRFTALNIPYAANNTPNPLAGVETQSIIRTPVSAGLTAKRITKARKVGKGKRRHTVRTYSARLSGSVNAGGEGAAGATVTIFAGTKKIATATTNANGSFTKTFKLRKTTTYHFTATAAANENVGGACEPPLPIPGGGSAVFRCGTITQSGFSATSNNVKVTKPKPKKKKKKK